MILQTANFPENPPKDLQGCIIIPAYHEPHILDTIYSLSNCLPLSKGSVEVIIILNNGISAPENVKFYHGQLYSQLSQLSNKINPDQFRLAILYAKEIPDKWAGVGMARKIGMDVAWERLQSVFRLSGFIANLDADCQVDTNYLITLDQFFRTYPAVQAASLYFEHPFTRENEPIVDYELHLRLYNQALRKVGFPLAFHTVGSSMVCRASVYKKVGGMNKRKAGEDFYFIQKLLKTGSYADLSKTIVKPSGRSSDRVPFGTGKAVTDIKTGNPQMTYHPDSFLLLQTFLSSVFDQYPAKEYILHNLPSPLMEYLKLTSFHDTWKELLDNTASRSAFRKRFFHVFDGFQVMKMLHFFRNNGFPDWPVLEAANRFFDRQDHNPLLKLEALTCLRKMERENPVVLDEALEIKLLKI